jgi:ecotropic viral integration site 5 protein
MASDSVDVKTTPTGADGATLDTLLSPKDTAFDSQPLPRDSVAESELSDIPVDEERFSNVPLSSQKSADDEDASLRSDDTKRDSNSNSSATLFNGTNAADFSVGHKKTASTTTIRSTKNLPFLMGHLDLQKSDEKRSSMARVSVDGKHQLQEEFARLQREQNSQEEQTVQNGGGGGIDWGECHTIDWVIITDSETFCRLLGGCDLR